MDKGKVISAAFNHSPASSDRKYMHKICQYSLYGNVDLTVFTPTKLLYKSPKTFHFAF